MAQNNTLGRNIEFPIMNSDDTPFHALVLHKATYESTIMSLGDKITGDVYYADNTLAVTMQEYIEYGGVHYVLVNPPTIVREGIVSDNSGLNGMTKYSFVFYHPMYMLSNFPFTDVAVSSSETQYLSESKKFSWCGTGMDFIAKLNKNLENTQWVVVASGNEESLAKLALLPSDIPTSKSTDTAKSNVLTFDNAFIADALKTMYDTWEVPFVIDNISEGEYFDSNNNDYYYDNKRFVIVVGLPSNEILDENEETFVFQFGKGVGLKNNSRTPRNNKIVTRIAGIGSERNIPYGYPQVRWYGTSGAKFTYGDAAGVYTNVTIGGHTFAKVVSYPIYKGILGGQYVELIKHPFTRKTLMPSVYAATLFNKISPYLANGSVNTNYNPDLTIVDYYDAIGNTYPNPIVPDAPSYETHQFDNVYPRLGSAQIVGVLPYDEPKETTSTIFPSVNLFLNVLNESIGRTNNGNEKAALQRLYNAINAGMRTYADSNNGGSYTFNCTVTNDGNGTMFVKYTSDGFNIDTSVTYAAAVVEWDDTMDDDGKYKQQYFKMTLPQLDFDLYACASITEQMNIVMRSGACIGCTFEVSIDWDDYKSNFFHQDGTFDPVPHTTENDGHVRDASKYPDSSAGQIVVVVKKDLDTFGTLMPNIYQQPTSGDEFVFTGISLPESYITNAQIELDETSQQYMLENNVHYYDYPLKFDEHFLATHTNILAQIRNNTIIEFKYGNETPNKKLYVKQITVKYGDKPLPQYDITLTDDVEIVLNKIGQVTDDVSRLRLQLTELMQYYGVNGVLAELIAEKLSRINDDVAEGRITFKQGLVSSAEIITESAIQSSGFVSGLYTGKGWRIDELGNAELESLRVRSYLEVIELLINRVQAMEGDTMFSDNDQIEKVTTEYDANNQFVSYRLSLKEKWSGYVTAQLEGNILKGIINTLAAKQAGVSDESNNNINKQGVDDGGNRYYTSWMRVTETHNSSNSTLGVNEIRVVLYGDNDTPAKKNFAPCELMTIARWGCLDADDNASASVKASVKRRQTVFYLSASEGRIVKLTGVNKPILEDGNYGMVFGTIPDFIKSWSSWRRLVAQYPHLEDRDYLYAQGLIYQDLVHVDIKGAPVPVTVDCGDWIDGSTASGAITDEYGDVVQLPAIRHGIYFNVGWNPKSQQFERHTVRHNNGIWLCLQNQPVTVNGVSTYYEPEYNSLYWKLIDGDGRYRIEIDSSSGDVFNTPTNATLTPRLFFGNVDITNTIPTSAWSWERSTESGTTSADTTWNKNHVGVRVLNLTSADYPNGWSDNNKAIFTAKVNIFDTSINNAYGLNSYPPYTWGDPSTYPAVGTIVLLNYSTMDNDMIDVWEESSSESNVWDAYSVKIGSLYRCSLDQHLYEATTQGWVDKGVYNGDVVSKALFLTKVSNGTSAIVVDLDNQMTNVACDKDGNVVGSSDPQLTTTINVYKGGTRQQVTFDDIDCEINNTSILSPSYINGYKATADLGTGAITIYVQRGTNISNSTEVVITMGTSVDGEVVEHTLTFTIGGVRAGADGEPATLYELLPSKDAISFTRNPSGGLTPSADSFYMEIKKTDGDGVSVIARQGWGTLLKVMYSATEPPDSTTVTTNVKEWGTDSSDITFSGNTAIVPNAGIDRIYLALFQLSDNQYVLIDRETIPVVKDGAKGNDGKTIQEVTIYKVQETKPSTPTGGSMADNVLTPPENWLATPPSTLSTTRSGDFLIVQSGSKKGWRKAQGDKSDTQQFFKDTISFTTSKPNEYIKIHIVTSCETGSGTYYDFACVGELDVNYTSRSQVESISDSRKADGESDVTIVTKIPTASSHSIQVIYTKDDLSWSGEDCAWYRIEDLDIWASVSKFIDDVQSGSWSEPVRWNGTSGNSGNDGRNGTNGVSYQIILQSASAVVSANGILNASVECTLNRTSGVTTTSNYPTGRVQAIIGTRTVTLSKTSSQHSLELSNEDWSSLGNPKEIVLQCYTAGGQNPPILATTTVPITIQGQMGRNIYYAGMFDDVVGTTFTATDYEAPYVNIGTTSSPQCYVYVGDNGIISYPSTAEGFANNRNWESMETNFNYLITKAMFSDFAKLGSAIFNKDFMFSQYLENEFVMLDSSQSINNTVYFEAINGQTSIPVTAGVTYTLLITCATTSGASVPVTFRVYYNTKSDWTGTEHAGVADVNNTSTTTSTVEHTFTAEYDGYVRLYGMGVGSVTKIASKASASYNEVSPMFLNGDDILLVINTQATNSTTQRSVVALPIPVNNGRQYTVSFYGYVGGGTGYVYIVQNGSNIASTSFSNTSPAQKSITFTASASGNVYIQYKSSSSSYYTYVYQMYIKCNNPMIPKVAVNWLTGYAHFAGDNVRFNPDGSGFVAGGNISWDIAGNATFNGTINATGGNITGVMNVGNTSGYYVRLNPNSSGAYVEGVDYNSGNPVTRFTLGFATDNVWELYKSNGFLKMGTSLLTDGFMKVGGKSSFVTLPATEDGTYAYMAAYSLTGPVIELSRKIGTTTKTFRASMDATTGQTIISLEGLSISGLPSSGTNTGDVYVDSNGFLRIKTS